MIEDKPLINESDDLDVMGAGKILKKTASHEEDPEIDLNSPLRGSKSLSKKGLLSKKYGDDIGSKSPIRDGKKIFRCVLNAACRVLVCPYLPM